MKEAALMKIVIVKSPKLFGGILRRLFGIKYIVIDNCANSIKGEVFSWT